MLSVFSGAGGSGASGFSGEEADVAVRSAHKRARRLSLTGAKSLGRLDSHAGDLSASSSALPPIPVSVAGAAQVHPSPEGVFRAEGAVPPQGLLEVKKGLGKQAASQFFHFSPDEEPPKTLLEELLDLSPEEVPALDKSSWLGRLTVKGLMRVQELQRRIGGEEIEEDNKVGGDAVRSNASLSNMRSSSVPVEVDMEEMEENPSSLHVHFGPTVEHDMVMASIDEGDEEAELEHNGGSSGGGILRKGGSSATKKTVVVDVHPHEKAYKPSLTPLRESDEIGSSHKESPVTTQRQNRRVSDGDITPRDYTRGDLSSMGGGRRSIEMKVAPKPGQNNRPFKRSVSTTNARPSFLVQFGKLNKRPTKATGMNGMLQSDIRQSFKSVEGVGEGAAKEGEILVPKLSRRLKVYYFFEDPSSSLAAMIIGWVILVLILLSSIAMVVESMPEYRQNKLPFFIIDCVCILVFTLEFVLRFATCPSKKVFVKDVMNIIDFLAIVPFYVDLTISLATDPRSLWTATATTDDVVASRILRMFRLIRVLRVLKLSRYSVTVQLLLQAIAQSLGVLSMLLFMITIIMVVCATFMFFLEAGEWDEGLQYYVRIDGKRSPFQSIPASFWWCIVTLSTVGYGDEVPITTEGKLLAGATMLMGVVVISLPISVISSNFSLLWKKEKGQAMGEGGGDSGGNDGGETNRDDNGRVRSSEGKVRRGRRLSKAGDEGGRDSVKRLSNVESATGRSSCEDPLHASIMNVVKGINGGQMPGTTPLPTYSTANTYGGGGKGGEDGGGSYHHQNGWGGSHSKEGHESGEHALYRPDSSAGGSSARRGKPSRSKVVPINTNDSQAKYYEPPNSPSPSGTASTNKTSKSSLIEQLRQHEANLTRHLAAVEEERQRIAQLVAQL
eukprot:CAMPEP_0113887464 /NCGR_PEP_ID=MMETSP0780_2-20120614/12229_1 /TAXON_ID=652834 /ORGANISM="Palpitomonas bilix" /LENGTH=895 /DNA_ID=CAMNT_0000876001 /DNA_START=242 /DNA_END=2929 /DNA_ORIENTATION=+ /assembly_acc=CAM_ASM_000599